MTLMRLGVLPVLTALALGGAGSVSAADEEMEMGLAAPSGDPSFVSPKAKVEVLTDEPFFTEGAAVAPDGNVYFSDITFTGLSGMQAGHIWRYHPKTGKAEVFRSPSGMSNGLKFDAMGRLLAAEGADYGGRRITRTDLSTGKAEIVAAMYNGRRFNSPNDITLDEKGRIYFSDPRYLGHETIEQGVQGVYRIDLDGSVHRIITDAGKPNGVAVSPDQKTLYVVCNDNGITGMPIAVGDRGAVTGPTRKGQMALLAYDLAADGSATFREMLVDYSPEDGPDGLVCDKDGNLWVAVRDITRPGIVAYSPSGEEKAYIPTPQQPTNVAFGRGKKSKTLYMTYGMQTPEGDKAVLARIQVKKEGYHLPEAE